MYWVAYKDGNSYVVGDTIEAVYTTYTEDELKTIVSNGTKVYGVSKVGEITPKGNFKHMTNTLFTRAKLTNQYTDWEFRTEEDKMLIYGKYKEKAKGTVEIPYFVNALDIHCFYVSVDLESINLNNIRVIERNAFGGCVKLGNITIPSCLTTIADMAFFGCASLQTVHFEDRVKELSIGETSFGNCMVMTSFGETLSYLKLSRLGEHAFVMCTNLTKLPVLETPEIGDYCFENCFKLQTLQVVFPETGGYIGYKAFSCCKILKSLIVDGGSSYVGDEAFDTCLELENIRLPIGSSVEPDMYKRVPYISKRTIYTSAYLCKLKERTRKFKDSMSREAYKGIVFQPEYRERFANLTEKEMQAELKRMGVKL